MKHLFLIFFILISSTAQASWKVGTKVLDVVPCPNKGCYISRACMEKKKNCDALKAFSRPKKASYTYNGPNPGSIVCKEDFSGKVMIGTDGDGNQEGFCVFADKSLLSLSGVWK